ncbi:MAG: hypothetical protein DRG37_00150 [Deltaproteobacteria bacterium]|nr:MAG: hypothetical protein DRG37_00150 [Deltaproteobacteria bacterium]
MAESKETRRFFTVARLFFLLVVIPLLLISSLIAFSIFQLGSSSKKQAITVLDKKSQEEILLRAKSIAGDIADFLKERQRDVLIATILPPDPSAYEKFVKENRKALWVKKGDKIIKIQAPLYKEMSLIDREGNELIKIVNGKIAPKNKLVNVSNPLNTTYKSEDYFLKAKGLSKGEVYISHVTGWYVSKSEFKKGKRFSGVIRFATPVFDKNGFAGVIELALDVRHLAKFTDNIIPTQPERVFEADASTGNYAYMVDNRGFIISHPNDYFIVGLLKNGKVVPPITKENLEGMPQKGTQVLNFNLLKYTNPDLYQIERDASAGHSGIKVYKFEGHTKFVAYAPIPFFSKDYPPPGGFGWIGLGVDIEKFKEQALSTSKRIEKEAQTWISTIIIILVVAVILLFLISTLLARGITRSIDAEVPPEAEEAAKHYDDDKIIDP